MVKDEIFISTGVVVGACLVAGLSLAVGNLDASAVTYETGADLQFTWEPILTVSVDDNMTINNLVPGSSSDSNIITVSTSSNSINGYYLYGTVGNSTTYTSTDLIYDASNPSSSNAKFSSVNGNKAAFVNFSDDTWGYSYSKDNGTTWVSGDTDNTSSGYNALPLYTSATGVKLIENTSSNGTTTIKFKIGAKASSTQVAGLYKNVVNFIGVPKVVTTEYTINFNDSSSAATTMPSPNPQTGTTTDGAVVLNNTTPVRSGYIFKGWCTQSTSDDTCSGNTVYPGSTYALGTSAATATVNLYAMWKANTAPTGGVTLDQAVYMQDNIDCASTANGATNTLIDNRNTASYEVVKIDGSCWMATNLALGDSTTMLLTPDNTNISSNYTLPASSTSGFESSTVPSMYNAGPGPCGANTPCYGYYNYLVATAGTNPSSGDNTSDICPKGWRLPRDAEYEDLIETYTTGAALASSPFKGVYAGVYNFSQLSNGGTLGLYWTSSSADAYSSGYMYYDTSQSDTAWVGVYYYEKYEGAAIRCVASNQQDEDVFLL